MRRLIGVTLASLMLAGCGGGPGEEYLGKWQRLKFTNQVIQIDRNGDNFIIRETAPNNGKMQTQNLPATLKDGVLQVSGQITISLAIDKSTGHLTGANAEYEKVN